jgi:hypothetical protein
MPIAWHSFDLKTGRRGTTVLTSKLGSVRRIIAESTDVTLAVHCWDVEKSAAIPGWDAATLPGAAGLLAVDDDDQILWGGFVGRRRGSIAGPIVNVTVSTLESYFLRRYVADHPVVIKDLADLFADFAGDALTDGPPIVIDCPATGIELGRATATTDDTRVGDLLSEFLALGLEWTVDIEWTDETHSMVRFVLRGRKRLGTASSTPEVTLRMPGNLISGEYVEDYTADHGANDVLATATGEGEERPQSAHHEAVLPTWVRFERRISPAGPTKELPTLDAYAADELSQTWDGLKELSLVARLDDSTSPHVWNIGDDLAVSITTPRFPERIGSDGSVIDGYFAIIRAIGWELDLDGLTITPILVERQEIP